MKVKKGDKVLVIKGRDRGKSGHVASADHQLGKVKVEGVNIHKRHQRRGGQNRQPGGIVEVVAAMPVESVMLICPSCNHPTRVGYHRIGEVKKRVCRVCKAIIEDVKK
ncbi:TPA: 50S ribosomal protein L24 [Patescibacteria group bacterium]|uniref:Large ribosomal subunit protein uL24 n=2 Tax=Bacteria division Kazan-3B-28 TaxID=1798534 RepID=A0A0G1X7B8_UNCK3|nr:MAG: 50S ribosomal protein L24, large subunit ribosomal protein L24 [candidate division Kazan bacterium GW2011_GWA1_50_15]KKW25409.1 MAG: 50S ribosomal protein L24 [candidate division Kazan bacterium GW2011_GWC1_52_13]KKW26715.1 MAG: 50S ribosomal protein L24 [candidate division Kazan bacterium GW2011_GWB1_52_7]HAV65712.1 50S ribosomal protein L24 [Patescibacteria group bacterium]HCL47574.1 50S ribosomal protein L24 [Patescibacteria group bacterium]